MDFLVDKLGFLGLNEREIRVFTALATFGRMSMTKTAARAGLPRTTVDAVIRRLINQGLVVKTRIGKHHEYAVVLEKVADTLEWIERRLRSREKLVQQKQKIGGTSDENIVINSSPEVVLKDIFSERAGDRVRVLVARNGDDIRDAVTRLNEYINLAILNNTKLEVLTCSAVADALRVSGLITKTHLNPNLIRLNIVPNTHCATPTDSIVFPDRIIIRSINPDKALVFSGEPIVESMKHLLVIACETGWRVNLSAWMDSV